MKKTLTVNLGGTVYHIDEDAYVLLDNYLSNLRFLFRKEKGVDEMIHDMETRIAELFEEYLRYGPQVITVREVEEVIARMGKPEDLNSDSGEENSEGRKTTVETDAVEENCSATRESGHEGEIPKVRRLFRNPDDRILGGVLSGLSAYMGWDATWLRILVIVIGLFVHGLIVAYLIAWFIIPLAQTAAEKLQMRGEPINMENIGKTVTGGFEKADESVHRPEGPHSFLHQLGNGVVLVAGIIIKVCLVVLAIICAPVLFAGLLILFALLMVATGLLASVPAVLYHVNPFIDWSVVSSSPLPMMAFSVCGLIVVGIPVLGLLQLIMQHFKIWRPISVSVKVILTIVWFLALMIGMILLWDWSKLYFC